MVECPKCGGRVDWNTDDKDQRCPRCKVMEGDDIFKILIELRKGSVPGQEPVLKMIEILAKKLQSMETAKNVGPANSKQN